MSGTDNEQPDEVEAALISLSSLLSKRTKDLDEREEELNKLQKSLDIGRKEVFGDTTPNDVLDLNVGGTKMTVLRRTLTSVPGSMLASKFSGRWDDSLERDKDGNFFIDQEFEIFETMINYLRNKSNETPRYPETSCPDPSGYNYWRMVEYYGMTSGVYPATLNLVHGLTTDMESTGPLEVNGKEWCTFQLSPRGHSRSIVSFEVTLGSVQRIQIGWMYNDRTSNPPFNGTDRDTNKGIGDVQGSSAIDLSRSCVLHNDTPTPIAGLELQEGSVVRSENRGENWYINGELVASVYETNGDCVHIGSLKNCCSIKHSSAHISVKGNIIVSKFEY